MSNDLGGHVPGTVTVVFPRVDGDDPYTVDVTLVSLAIRPEYAGVTGHSGVKVLHSTALADATATPTNSAELIALATLIAEAHYRWLLARLDIVYAGVVPWVPEGMHDCEWCSVEGEVRTRVQPPPEWLTDLAHHGTEGGGVPFVITGPLIVGGPTTFTNTSTITINSPIVTTATTTNLTIGGPATVENTFTFTNTSTPVINSSTITTSTSTTATFNGPVVTTATATTTLGGPITLNTTIQPGTTNNLAVSPPGTISLPTITITGAPTTTPTAGTYPITWNNVDQTLYVWNGTTWTAISPTGIGPGTQDFIPIWATTTTLGDSPIYKDGDDIILPTFLNVGTTDTPSATLTVVCDAATDVGLAVEAHASQSVDLGQFVGTVETTRFSYKGHFITGLAEAPSDGDLASSEVSIYLDDTSGDPHVHFKGKDSAGTVFDFAIPEGGGGAAGSSSPAWVKVTKSHTDLQAAATTNNIEVYSLPARGSIHHAIMKHSTAFSGGSISDYQLSLGLTGIADAFTGQLDADGSPSNTGFVQYNPTGAGAVSPTQNMGAATSIRLFAESMGDDLDQSSAGSVDIFLLVSTAPSLT